MRALALAIFLTFTAVGFYGCFCILNTCYGYTDVP